MPDNFDGYLYIDGIKSESKDPEHKGWIDVESFGFGCAAESFTMRARKGAPTPPKAEDIELASDGSSTKAELTGWTFTFKQGMHKGSPAMFMYCATGRNIPNVEFHVRKSGGNNPLIYFRVKLASCLIVKIDTQTDGGALPVETVTIAYRAVELSYQEQNSKTGGAFGGAVVVAYDKASHLTAEELGDL